MKNTIRIGFVPGTKEFLVIFDPNEIHVHLKTENRLCHPFIGLSSCIIHSVAFRNIVGMQLGHIFCIAIHPPIKQNKKFNELRQIYLHFTYICAANKFKSPQFCCCYCLMFIQQKYSFHLDALYLLEYKTVKLSKKLSRQRHIVKMIASINESNQLWHPQILLSLQVPPLKPAAIQRPVHKIFAPRRLHNTLGITVNINFRS